ncbi:MAG: nuclear transport factor 2 family protein [Acidimicrobiia bacterium]
MTVDDLVAKQEITEVLYRYARGVDRADWDLVRSCYHDDATDDHGVVRGSPDEFIAVVRQALGPMTSTMHTIGNVLIEVDGDVAASEAYAVCSHRFPAEDGGMQDMTVGVRYVDRMERRAGQWRIARRTVVWEWSRLDPVAGEFPSGPDFVWGRRDRGDASYDNFSLRAATPD